MDILRKLIKSFQSEADEAQAGSKTTTTTKELSRFTENFPPASFFDEFNIDDDPLEEGQKFAFQMFTNPLEMQKHFEKQMQQILEAVREMEENGVPLDKSFRDEFVRPGFDNHDDIFKEFHQKSFQDTDLDGEIYPEQFRTLMQRLNPQGHFQEIVPPSNQEKLPSRLLPNGRSGQQFRKPKLPDEEIIMGRIHGTLPGEDDEEAAALGRKTPSRPRMARPRHPEMMTPMTPMIPRDPSSRDIFEGNFSGPRMFRQSVVTRTVRKPDGSYETTCITQDSEGNKKKTVTRKTQDGRSETVVTYGDETTDLKDQGKESKMIEDHSKSDALLKLPLIGKPEGSSFLRAKRDIFFNTDGYALPKNMW